MYELKPGDWVTIAKHHYWMNEFKIVTTTQVTSSYFEKSRGKIVLAGGIEFVWLGSYYHGMWCSGDYYLHIASEPEIRLEKIRRGLCTN